MTHPNAELARSEMKAALRGDLEGMLEHYTDDVVLHYPGRNALSGIHRGKDGIRKWVAKIDELLGEGGSFTRSLHDIVANDDYAIQLVSVEARRGDGRSASWDAAAVMRVHNGKFSDIRLDIFDPYAVDELFA
ncbi:nuclear transport factor 2 family protein [Agromyces neolithicus]|uniref:SnoaL-like domain-containing protein n=1 Tax=Agromyces neolithicus TaxID=269420 RepID=A0ABN2LZY9_9MICO